MNRAAKISLLKAVKSGEASSKGIQLKGAICPPTWLLKQFETPDELCQDLKKTWGESVRVVVDNGKVFVIPPKGFKNKWFNYE